MTDDPDAKKTVNQRLTALEHTLFGDQVAIMKYKKAVAGYVTPRGTEPPPGMITRMQSQLESITETLAGIQHRLTGLEDFLLPVELVQKHKHSRFDKRHGSLC